MKAMLVRSVLIADKVKIFPLPYETHPLEASIIPFKTFSVVTLSILVKPAVVITKNIVS